MPDRVKEKLVELIEKASYECDEGTRDLWDMRQVADGIADFLIANGVIISKMETVATDNNVGDKLTPTADKLSATEWISVKDRLPESNKIVLASAVSKTFGYRHTLMVAHIGHHEATTEDDGWRESEVDTEYDEEKDCFWIPECWWEVNSVEDNGNWIIDSDYEVTHWTHLPQPPKGE